MFKALRNRYRLTRLFEMDAIKNNICCFRTDEDEYVHLFLDDKGQRHAYSSVTLQPIDIATVTIPDKDCFRWTSWDRKPFSSYYERGISAIKVLKARHAETWQGVPFIKVNGKVLYISRGSDGGEWFELTDINGNEFIFPTVMLNVLNSSNYIDLDMYTAKVVNLYGEGNPVEDWKPIIAWGNEPTSNQPAYSELIEMDGFPGMLELHTKDIVINISEIDNSATPIVDLHPFVKIIKWNLLDHNARWTLDVSNILLQVGKNPILIRVGDLPTEVPGHRFIMSNMVDGNESQHINYNVDLPSTYP
ncbi:hypothetical protein MZD04_gp288 [Pseudomonas phage Psa21]|uniref:Uncharacterized protein n=1 Tax=Pseudomonas phage Psa21 TaxID=2530023 RepID=A0A481W610_9CAUD|nr:hypothetical protein MZD04_gp288 [Pseudomonas phage Psa21]QBJ02814.1 hypothetical protein PSA21_288 [Pseudomonas phage Psa21]